MSDSGPLAHLSIEAAHLSAKGTVKPSAKPMIISLVVSGSISVLSSLPLRSRQQTPPRLETLRWHHPFAPDVSGSPPLLDVGVLPTSFVTCQSSGVRSSELRFASGRDSPMDE